MITIKSEKAIANMRAAGKIVAETHEFLQEKICPGITTEELDRLAYDFITSNKAIPSFKDYRGYKNTICASVNNEIIHGIPCLRELKNGDIISIDLGAEYNGYHGDCARTHPVGTVSLEALYLIEVTEESFYQGLMYARPGHRLSDISNAIQTYVESRGFSVVRGYVGHGIGRSLHEEPDVPNYGRSGHGPRLTPGMTLAIEPMVNAGKRHTRVSSDRWTVITADCSLSAHYENTILITTGEPEILTKIQATSG